MKTASVIILAFVFSLNTFAQTNFITGKISDASAGEPLAGANILIIELISANHPPLLNKISSGASCFFPFFF